MSKADVQAGKAFVSLYMKDGLTKPLKNAKKELNDFGSGLVSIGAKVLAAGAAITGAFTAAVAHFANTGSELNDMSARTGVSTTALAELGYAAEQTGSNMETLEDSIKKMQKNLGGIGKESKKAKAALSAMGLEIARIKGLPPDEQFELIAEAISKIEHPSRRAAAAIAIFGGTELLPMLEDLRALRKEAQELGIAPSPESIKAADALGDAIDRVRKVVKATVFEVGATVGPMAQTIVDGFLVAVQAVKKFVTENKALVITIAKVGVGLAAAGAAIMGIGIAFIKAGMVITGFLTVFNAISATAGLVISVMGAILSPLGLLLTALAAGAYAWTRFTDSGRDALSGFAGFATSTLGGISTTFNDTFGSIVDAIKGRDLALAGEIAMTALQLAFAKGFDAILGVWTESKAAFESIWDEIGFNIAASWINTTAFLANVWRSAMANLEDMGRTFVDFFIGMLNEVIAMIDEIQVFFDETLGVEGQKIGQIRKLGPKDRTQVNREMDAREQKRLDDLKSLREMQGGPRLPAEKPPSDVARLESELQRLKTTAANKAEEFKRPDRMDAADAFTGGSDGKASAAMFSAAGLLGNSTAGGGQLQAILGTKKAVEQQTQKQKEAHAQLLAAVKSMGLHHA